jgi:hypothetical protein
MRIRRRDSLFVSSVLFTIALLWLIPTFWGNVLTGRDEMALWKLDAGDMHAAETMSQLSVASLAVILIGLIVVWMGYAKRERWTWLVMLILVWVWAFPLLALPPLKALFEGRMVLTLSEWLYTAINHPRSARAWAESVLIFLLMVIALLLPIKKFFIVREIEETIHRPSPRLMGMSFVGVLVIISTLFTWIRLGVLYEIPLSELNSTQRLPSPPAPPTWNPCKPQ